MHPLTLLATGLYGQELPPQDGAPVRLVDAVEVRLQGHQVDRQDHADRDRAAVDVEPAARRTSTASSPTSTRSHDHPRWSQATEQRIGESGRRPTLMFNGYADQVASLYAGMDLDVHF